MPEYQVKEVVCDYGVFKNRELIPQLILNSKANANEIVRILEVDDRHERFVEKDIKKSYLHFKEMPVKESMKTKIVAVYSLNGANHLGEIRWYPQWRRYAFFPDDGTVFDPDCLEEIAEKVRLMTKDYSDKRKKAMTDVLFGHHLDKQS